MRKLGWIALLLLAGCQDEPDADDQAVADARDVAAVERANDTKPPLEQLTPEPILLPDIERYDLIGEACNYAPGTSFGVRVIARPSDAFLKIGNEVVRLASDPGSRELPMHTRSLYSGKEYALRLVLADASAESGPGDYEGAVTLRDQWGRIVYEGTGLAQCKG